MHDVVGGAKSYPTLSEVIDSLRRRHIGSAMWLRVDWAAGTGITFGRQWCRSFPT